MGRVMRLLLAVLAMTLAGCATETTLVNDRGEKRYCYMTDPFSAGADREYHRCLNEAGGAGFRKVN